MVGIIYGVMGGIGGGATPPIATIGLSSQTSSYGGDPTQTAVILRHNGGDPIENDEVEFVFDGYAGGRRGGTPVSGSVTGLNTLEPTITWDGADPGISVINVPGGLSAGHRWTIVFQATDAANYLDITSASLVHTPSNTIVFSSDYLSIGAAGSGGGGGVWTDPTEHTGSVAGEVWFSPLTGTLSAGTSYSDEIHVNSGSSAVAAYKFIITYNENVLSIDTSQGEGGTGVSPGADGFMMAANPGTPGILVVNGADPFGKGPGSDMHFLTIYWTATAAGTSDMTITVDQLTDPSATPIGTPTGVPGSRTVE
jgi:hypothetical protein